MLLLPPPPPLLASSAAHCAASTTAGGASPSPAAPAMVRFFSPAAAGVPTKVTSAALAPPPLVVDLSMSTPLLSRDDGGDVVCSGSWRTTDCAAAGGPWMDHWRSVGFATTSTGQDELFSICQDTLRRPASACAAACGR